MLCFRLPQLGLVGSPRRIGRAMSPWLSCVKVALLLVLYSPFQARSLAVAPVIVKTKKMGLS